MNSLWVNFALLVGLLRSPIARFASAADGAQEAVVRVRGRYRPSVIKARRGVPLRITFDRQEATPCSEWVVFAEPRQELYLPPFRRTTIELLPAVCGEHLFTCRMGVYQGTLMVRNGGRVRAFLGRLFRSQASPWAQPANHQGVDGQARRQEETRAR